VVALASAINDRPGRYDETLNCWPDATTSILAALP